MQRNPYTLLVLIFAVFLSAVLFVNIVALIWRKTLDYKIHRLYKKRILGDEKQDESKDKMKNDKKPKKDKAAA
jgi:hypothetical protein